MAEVYVSKPLNGLPTESEGITTLSHLNVQILISSRIHSLI